MKAIIMAGGEGTRLRPLTCDRPKPMVPVGNRPVMEYAIELLKTLNITEIGVTLQYLPQDIMDFFGDGKEWGVNLNYFIEDVPLGTAGSVKNAGDFLDETFLVVSGDALTDLDLSRAIEFHRSKKAIGTLVLTSVTNPLEYGVVITNTDGSIQRFLEKPGWGEVFSDWVNTGIYVLEPEALNYFDSGQKYDFSKDLFPQLLRNKEPLYGCLLEGYWCDIGNLEQYLQAHRDILAGRVKVTPRGTLIEGKFEGEILDEYSEPVNIKGPVLIGENCRLGKGVKIEPYTVLGDNVVVDHEASIKRSVLWNNVYVGKKASISGAAIGNKVTIRDNASIYEDAAIGDGTYINSRSVIKPQVKIWPCKSINTGVVVSESLVWGEGANKNLFGSEGIPGLINWDITPELAAKLGACFGSTQKEHVQVAVSCDGKLATKMLKSSFIAGLLSTGIKAADLGDLIMPIHRFAVRSLGTAAGVHIKMDYSNPDKCWIQFVDSQGISVNRDTERKIEGLYLREDFRRVKEGEIEQVTPYLHFVDSYLDNLINVIGAERIRQRGFNVALYSKGTVLDNIFDALSNRIGCNFYNCKDDVDEGHPARSLHQAVGKMADIVRQGKMDLGIIMDANGERIMLVDSAGRIVNEHMFTVLMSLILFKANKGGAVAVPVTASEAIERVAQKYNAKVVRTKTAPWVLMGELLREEMQQSQGAYSQFYMQNDALYAVIILLDFMSKEDITLSELLDEVPDFHLQVKSAECPWEEKGRIMRALINESKDKPVELLDGVKIRHENGWVLVLPHSEEPRYQIYTEGVSQEIAEELGAFYQDKIKRMLLNK